jgi:hypothetical protein
MPSLYDELELVQSRSSADDGRPQPLDDNAMSADLDLVDDEDDLETMNDVKMTLVELMEPVNEAKKRLTSKDESSEDSAAKFLLLFALQSKESQGRNQ